MPLSHRKMVAALVQSARKDMPYREISERLKAFGVEMDEGALRKIFSNGTMQASLMLVILDVLGVTKIVIPDLLTDLKVDSRTRRRNAKTDA